MTLAITDAPLHWTWLMPLLMGLSFVTILFFGKRLPKKGAEVGIACVGLCFAFALVSAASWIGHVNDANDAKAAPTEQVSSSSSTSSESPAQAGEAPKATGGEEEKADVRPITTDVTWFEIGGTKYKVGTFVDGLSVLMMLVVSLVSLLVHIYSTDYVGGDRRYTHYFAFLSLFTASMLMLIMSSSTVEFITSWELVGLCSFALIGHWWEEKPNSDAALKAFLTNRVGDIGLLIGMIILFWASKTFDIGAINTLANNGSISHNLLLAASCCLVLAVMSKSGQFILHTWLPDAMAGPTPVSALIHAATMVVAGIFMVARLYGVFWNGLTIGGSHVNLLAIVGAVTLLFGGLLAFVQSDIKKVLAYSTVSQLGYMAMALGVGGWTAAVFHLFTHAFFKAGLFLGSGSVAHSVHSFDMKKDMGGMRRFMPKTFWTFIICSVALAGVAPLAGFWSKDEILAAASGSHGLSGYPLMLWMGIIGGALTAAYMTRCVYLTFFGEPRGHAADPHHPPHESGPRIVIPLYILSGLALIAGFANWPFFSGGYKERFSYYVQPAGAYFPAVPAPEFTWWIAGLTTLAALAAIFLAYLYWFRGAFHGATERFKLVNAGQTLLVNKYYFDHLYTDIIAGGTKGPVARAMNWVNQNVIDGVVNGTAVVARSVAGFTYAHLDQQVIDGAVNGSGAGAEETGQVLRKMQSGRVQQYGALLFGGAIVLAGVLIFTI